MHNAQYDAGWIRRMGFTINGRIIDTMLVAALLDENRFSYSLNSLSYDLLGKIKTEKTLQEAAREFGLDPSEMKMPAMHVGPYAQKMQSYVGTLELPVNSAYQGRPMAHSKTRAKALPCLMT